MKDKNLKLKPYNRSLIQYTMYIRSTRAFLGIDIWEEGGGILGGNRSHISIFLFFARYIRVRQKLPSL